MSQGLIAPHGGRLTVREVTGNEAASLAERARSDTSSGEAPSRIATAANARAACSEVGRFSLCLLKHAINVSAKSASISPNTEVIGVGSANACRATHSLARTALYGAHPAAS